MRNSLFYSKNELADTIHNLHLPVSPDRFIVGGHVTATRKTVNQALVAMKREKQPPEKIEHILQVAGLNMTYAQYHEAQVKAGDVLEEDMDRLLVVEEFAINAQKKNGKKLAHAV